MPLTNEDGFGGSTGGVCTPSPSDQLAITNNLISRITDIERFLSRLIGADVNANNLAELATNMGNLLNGTIAMPSGYSPYGPGGSIPVPEGFNGTVVSGNTITTWTNGVVSFQVTPTDGITVGGLKRAARADMDSSVITLGSGMTLLKFSNPNTEVDDIGITFGATSFSVPVTGWYYISCIVFIQTNATGNTGNITMQVNPTSSASVLEDRLNWALATDLILDPYILKASGIIDITAGTDVYVQFDPALGSGGSTATVYIENLSILKL